MKSILDPSFHYTPSVATDIRKTFERIRRELPPKFAPRTSIPRLALRALLERRMEAVPSRQASA